MVTSELLWIGPIQPRSLDPILLFDRVFQWWIRFLCWALLFIFLRDEYPVRCEGISLGRGGHGRWGRVRHGGILCKSRLYCWSSWLRFEDRIVPKTLSFALLTVSTSRMTFVALVDWLM